MSLCEAIIDNEDIFSQRFEGVGGVIEKYKTLRFFCIILQTYEKTPESDSYEKATSRIFLNTTLGKHTSNCTQTKQDYLNSTNQNNSSCTSSQVHRFTLNKIVKPSPPSHKPTFETISSIRLAMHDSQLPQRRQINDHSGDVTL